MDEDKRRTLRIVGAVLLVGGIALMLTAMFLLITGGQKSVESFGETSFNPAPFMIMFILGGILASVGGWCLKLGFLKAAADLISTETAGAVQHSTAALGRGIGKGLKESGWSHGGRDIIKVKCRGCGFLESEDAKFCSQCAKAM